MLTGRRKELWEKAERERRACEKWLRRYLRPGQQKPATKAELRDAAIRELGVSKNSFDAAWIAVIETSGRYDWYEPLRKPPRTCQ